jgi:hypothetical protein
MTYLSATTENEVMSASIRITPSTLEGISRLATAIKREQRITHTKALDIAAQRAGFGNLRNAQHELGKTEGPARSAAHARYPIWITAYWRDKQGDSGRETLCVSARLPWGRLLKPTEISASRGLGKFKADAADHFETPKDLFEQSAARRAICEAARTLQFMEATGLRPLTGHVYRRTKGIEKLPRRDHASAWRDPDSSAIVVVDEPYISNVDETLSERSMWASEGGAAIAATKWAGMYSPTSATMFLTSLDGRADLLMHLVANLDAASSPVIAEHWAGESAPYAPQFVSPERSKRGKAKRARPKPLYRGLVRRNAIVYGQVFVGGSWRPNARMPLMAHQEAGNLLKELIECGRFRSRAYSRLEHVRCELDEWVQREYPSRAEMSDDQFSSLYYHEFKESGFAPKAAIVCVETLLRAHYPDCVPRRNLLRGLATATKDLGR